MAILYSNYASDLLSHSSRVAGNIGYALTPGRNPVIGGGSLGVSKYTKRPEDAPFLHQMDVQRTRGLRGHAAGQRIPLP